MKRLRFTLQAPRDLQDIHDFIAEDSCDEALMFIDRLQERCNELCEMPGIGRKREELAAGIRSSVIGDYLIFYRVLDGDVVVVHVLHGRRDLPRLFDLD